MNIKLEQGQVVKVRNKIWSITNLSRTVMKNEEPIHKVTLECLEDNGLGKTIDVIWEREVFPQFIESTSLPAINGIDRKEAFDAFLMAIKWSCFSAVEGNTLQAPFRGGVQIEEYQLVPVIRAAQMPRVTLLIADDVGLGKTIEAGLVAQELIHSHRATKILILCPAHLQTKWVDEMAEKFGLEFRIIDRDAVQQMKKEFGPTINPWGSFPRIVTSIDYLKREHPKRLFDELVDRSQNGAFKPWDLLILDEAHNVSPSGRKNYVRDSDRTVLLRSIAKHFEHRLFLTATPHNGYRESFTGLLELLDNLRFSRGTTLSHSHLNTVTIRRLKEDIKNPDGTRRFPPRIIMPRDEIRDPGLYVKLLKSENEIFELLKSYTESRLNTATKKNLHAVQFVLTLLKKRALSSPLALRESLITHLESVGESDNPDVVESLFHSFVAKEQDEWNDDEEKDSVQTAALEQASKMNVKLIDNEKQWLKRLCEITNDIYKGPDTKAKALIKWIKANLQDVSGKWNDEKVIIFTEYIDTLTYLTDILRQEGMSDNILTIYGGMTHKEREMVNNAFQSSPSEHPVRILIATDAASEGADFQRYCRNLIHYEIPWNPVRLEQRNGRIDRHGQLADEVRIHHFVYRNQEDSEFLKRIVEKVETIRSDLGSVSSVIADNIKKHALGHKINLAVIDKDSHRQLVKEDFVIDKNIAEETVYITKKLNNDRDSLGITNRAQMNVLKEAFKLEGLNNCLDTKEDDTHFEILNVPKSWNECHKYVSTPIQPINLTFDREIARNNAKAKIVHLEHPLMRRAISSLRSQMWKSTSLATESVLNRVSCLLLPGIKRPFVIAWGRLVLLGPENNLLHEGLIRVAATVKNKGLIVLSQEDTNSLLRKATETSEKDIDITSIRRIVTPIVNELEILLNDSAEQKEAELNEDLRAYGEKSAKQTRSLATERIQEIRKTISKMEKEKNDTQYIQLKLFDEEEQQQYDIDLHLLKIRLGELEKEREIEPRRIRDSYKVHDRKIYPLAVQLIMPPEVILNVD